MPSNFVEKLEGEELFDFNQQVVLGLGDCDDSVCTSIPQDLDFMSADESMETDHHKLPAIRKTTTAPPESILKRTTCTTPDAELSKAARASLPQYASCTDLDMTEDDEADQEMELKGGQVPCPRHLTFEPQQNRYKYFYLPISIFNFTKKKVINVIHINFTIFVVVKY